MWVQSFSIGEKKKWENQSDSRISKGTLNTVKRSPILDIFLLSWADLNPQSCIAVWSGSQQFGFHDNMYKIYTININ